LKAAKIDFMERTGWNMRSLCFLALMALTQPLWAADWKPLPSTASYQSQVDLDSVGMYGGFLVNRAYVVPQTLSSGKAYSNLHAQYYVLCNEGKVSLESTQYFSEGGKLTHIDFRKDWKLKFAPPKKGSDTDAAMKQVCERLAGNNEATAAPKKTTPAKPAARSVSTGSGIVITPSGLIVTNEHVVRKCDSVEIVLDSIRTVSAEVRALDPDRDLALLIAEVSFPLAARVRQDAAPRLGEAVAVIGYPLVSVLSAQPNVSFGNVNSTVGVKGNQAQMQIDVPIQKGNSGGPVLDSSGNVIGIVVSKLDALKLAKSTGDLPQNINFAIRGDVVRSFLEAQHVDFAASSDSSKLENTEIAKLGIAVTVQVRCIRDPAQVSVPPATTSPR
jgi:S1-C subfamily serine protease